jgi:hypothetical protein
MCVRRRPGSFRIRSAPGRQGKRGAIAQLGERLLCKQEVGGSIPPGSTTSPESAEPRVFMHDVCSRGSVRRRENSRATRSLTIRKVLTSSDWRFVVPTAKRVIQVSHSQYDQRHVAQSVWGYMVKRISARGGCLGGRRR